MDVNALNQLSQTTSGKTADSAASIAKTFDNFLTLLTTQLKNQDPLSPMESAEFTNQLVLFSQVEQQININSKLDDMLTMQKSNELLSATSYLGRQVEATTDTLSLDAPAEFSYTLVEKASSLTAVIKDSSGATVRTMSLSGDNRDKGAHTVTWDGRNDAGTLMPVGTYSLALSGTNSSGGAVALDQPSDRLLLSTPTSPRFAYAFPEAPYSAQIKILDSEGVAVRTLVGDPSNGRHEGVWDGKDASGNLLPAGQYKISISALDEAGTDAKGSDGNPIEAVVATVNRVRDVRTSASGAQLLVGRDTYVSLSDVIAIRS